MKGLPLQSEAEARRITEALIVAQFESGETVNTIAAVWGRTPAEVHQIYQRAIRVVPA